MRSPRRKPDLPGTYQHISVDLQDRTDCEVKLKDLTDITHLFYVAFIEAGDAAATAAANCTMFVNVVEVVDASSPVLEHVHLSEGGKWYGTHLGPHKNALEGGRPQAHAA